MKKRRILVLSVIIALVLLGTGYAAWTDTLTINTTASTGKLNVEFVNEDTDHPYIVPLERLGHSYLDPAPNIDVNDANDKITVTVNKLYPGSGVLYDFKFINNGTVPVKFDYADVEYNPQNEALAKKLITVGGFIQLRPKRFWPIAVGWMPGGTLPGTNPGLPTDKPGRHLSDLKNNLDNMLKNVVMQPGDYILFDIPEVDENGNPLNYKSEIAALLESEGIEGFNPEEHNCIIMGLPKSAGNDLQRQEFEFSIKLNFKQHNQ